MRGVTHNAHENEQELSGNRAYGCGSTAIRMGYGTIQICIAGLYPHEAWEIMQDDVLLPTEEDVPILGETRQPYTDWTLLRDAGWFSYPPGSGWSRAGSSSAKYIANTFHDAIHLGCRGAAENLLQFVFEDFEFVGSF